MYPSNKSFVSVPKKQISRLRFINQLRNSAWCMFFEENKKLKSTLMRILQEAGAVQILITQTMCYRELASLYVMRIVLWFGAANSKPKLPYQQLKQSTLHYLRLWGRPCLWLAWWRKLTWFFPFSCHHQGLLSRSEKTISHALRWHRIPSSLLEQNTLQSSIITFTSMLSLSQIQMDFSILIIAQQMIR